MWGNGNGQADRDRREGGLNKPGRYGDGEASIFWSARAAPPHGSFGFRRGKRRDIGLGSSQQGFTDMARERAAEARSQVEAGIDPVRAQARRLAFQPSARRRRWFTPSKSEAGATASTRTQWLSNAGSLCLPHDWRPAGQRDRRAAVRDLLAEIWLDKPETARRVRQRIGAVLDWAVCQGLPRQPRLPCARSQRALPRQPRKAAIMRPCRMPTFRLSSRGCARAKAGAAGAWRPPF